MTTKGLPKSIRKYIRREKARIRREVWGDEERKELIDKLYKKIFKKYKYENKRNF